MSKIKGSAVINARCRKSDIDVPKRELYRMNVVNTKPKWFLAMRKNHTGVKRLKTLLKLLDEQGFSVDIKRLNFSEFVISWNK